MKTDLFFLLICLTAVLRPAAAQERKADWGQLRRFEHIVRNFNNTIHAYPTFINGTDRFWYSMQTSRGITYYIVDPDKKSHRELFNMDNMLAQIASLTREAFTSLEFRYKTLEFAEDGKSFTFNMAHKNFRYDMGTRRLSVVPAGKEGEKPARDNRPSGHLVSPDSTRFIYAYRQNLYMYGNGEKGMDTTVIQLTTDGTRYRSYAKYPGESEQGHSYPAGRWLKDSKGFLVTMEDESVVKNEMHLVDMLHEPLPGLKSYKYNIPGDEHLSLYSLQVLDIDSRKMTVIEADRWKDQYVEFAYDNTDKGSEIFFYRYKRTWDEKELCAYDVNTGRLRTLFDEVDRPYLDYVIKQTHFLNGADEILFRSERTGWGHFYLYDGRTGRLKRAVTEGSYVTGQVIEIDTARREVYHYGFGREKGCDPYYYKVYRTHLDRPGTELLTPEDANHSKTYFTPSFKYFIDVYSTVDKPSRMVVRNRRGKVVMELAEPDMKPLYDAGWRAPERFCVKAADGITDLYGVMWKPMDFDSTKVYPIISEVYPGPQYEYVPTTFGLEAGQASALAQLGFIVIQTGHRGGTPMRGKVYHTYGYRKLRDYALADDRAVITGLARRHPYIDGTRAGMFGHSGGGFMSAAAVCSSDFYKAVVACAGNHDNRIYNRGWIEMNNGVEEKIVKNKENPADSVQFRLARIHTNVEIASRCRGHLLLVHGMMDDNVHPAQAFRLARALMDAGINFDMLALPGSTHGFAGSEDDYYRFKMMNHFAKYLLGDTSGEYVLHFKKDGD